MSPTISLEFVRTLDLAHAVANGRPAHVSAASGLVAIGEWLYTVIDDEVAIARFPLRGNDAGTAIALLTEALPLDARERKAAKPDWEALLRLPAFGMYPHGALWAIGSGSRSTRTRSVLVPLAADGEIVDAPRIVDLASLYSAIAVRIPALNLEGALLLGDAIWLFHRDGKPRSPNIAITLDAALTLQMLALGTSPPAEALRDFHMLELGAIEGVPLGITDACALDDGRIAFCAVAEDTDNAYDDGACVGSVVGVMDGGGRVVRVERIASGDKVEGIAARRDGGAISLLLVTDADDAEIPARLLRGAMRHVP